jgi:hypothetical protein
MSRNRSWAPTTHWIQRLLAVCTLVFAAAACTSTPDAAPTPGEYRSAVQAVCTTTSQARGQLSEPTEPGAVADFARTVAGLLNDEADIIRNIRPPAELDDDHRAFVQNTADQAQRWTTLATTPPTDTATFGAVTEEIASLSFGRDDLAGEMLLGACQRTS